MKPRKSTRHRGAQVILLIFCHWMFSALGMAGLQVGRRIGATIGRLLYLALRKHRGRAVNNIKQAEGLLANGTDAHRLARRAFEHLGMVIAEISITRRLLRRGRLDDFVTIGGIENIEAALAGGKGAIISMGHLGNWETTSVQFARRVMPFHALYRPVENPNVDRFLRMFRSHTGIQLIPAEGAADKMQEVLGNNGLLNILSDRDAGDRGVFVDFFGRSASTVKSVAILSLRYRSPILPVNVYRENGRLWMVYDKPIHPSVVDGESDRVRALTQRVASKLEGFIRCHPEQWIWMYQRWRTRPLVDGHADANGNGHVNGNGSRDRNSSQKVPAASV